MMSALHIKLPMGIIGEKYAWRRFGLVVAQGAFHQYLIDIAHPYVPCKAVSDDIGVYSHQNSIAYKEDGLEEAMNQLIETAGRNGRYFSSPLSSTKFQIKPVNATCD